MLGVTLYWLNQHAFAGTLHYEAVMALRATKLTANYTVYICTLASKQSGE